MRLPKNRIFDRPFVLSMGPQRTGTSWLDRYLRTRGDVCLPGQVKEVFFFDRHYHRGVDFYRGHFLPQDGHQFVMEVSTTAFDSPDAPRHVHEVFGKDITLLCPLRHPVVRAYSLYLHYKRYGIVSGSLQKACREQPQILQSSRYTTHLKRWFEYYPKEDVHIVFQEDLEKSPAAYVEAICALLDLTVKPLMPRVRGRYNETTRSLVPALASIAQRSADFLRYHGLYSVINFGKLLGLKQLIFGTGGRSGSEESDQMSAEDRAWLSAELESEVDKLEELIGVPIVAWRGVSSLAA
jgi:hypothetical protein